MVFKKYAIIFIDLLLSYRRNSLLCSTFLVLLIHLGLWSLNEGWHIYKIVEPVILIAVVFLVLASSDLAIDPEFSWYLISSYRTIRGKNWKNVWQVVENEETG